MRPSLLDPLFAALTGLPGIGSKLARLFARLLDREAPRLIDLLFHLPSGTIDRRARLIRFMRATRPATSR